MTKKAFDKIAEGLEEALAYANGNVVDKELVRDTISLRYSAKNLSGGELDNQLKSFIELTKLSGYQVTKKFIVYQDGLGIVEVEGKKNNG